MKIMLAGVAFATLAACGSTANTTAKTWPQAVHKDGVQQLESVLHMPANYAECVESYVESRYTYSEWRAHRKMSDYSTWLQQTGVDAIAACGNTPS